MHCPETLNKRYIVKKKIAEGGLCEVYSVEDTYALYFKDERHLVAKVPSPTLASKKDVSAFIYSEYILLSSLQHKNIVQVVDFGIDEGSGLPYLIMQKIEGEILANIPLHTVTKSMRERMMSSLYDAVYYIHEQGIVHADINPTNIMVAPDGEVCVFDFGISQNNVVRNHYNLAFGKMNAFNPVYCAPEVLNGKTPSFVSDLFSLGVVMYELYTGHLPYKVSSLELETSPLRYKDCKGIPLCQKKWFHSVLSFEQKMRVQTIPLSIRIKNKLQQCFGKNHKKVSKNET